MGRGLLRRGHVPDLPRLCRFRGLSVSEGGDRLRVKAVERADQLPPEHLQAMQAAPFLTPQVEVERRPVRVRIARILAEDVEMRFPRMAVVPRAERGRQRPVEGILPRE